MVVAIDLGTTYSGYAFSFTRSPELIHMMRKWPENESSEVNYCHHKIPTILLLKPDKSFHSFGLKAREAYHGLTSEEADEYLYFEKYKSHLNTESMLNRYTQLTSKLKNGQQRETNSDKNYF